MKIGFVIVNYNDYKTTIRLINNVKDYELINEIVVIDNNSTDNSYQELIKCEFKDVEIIKSDKNGGYSYALNLGCKYLINKYNECKIFVSNSDIIIDSEKDLNEMINICDKDNVIVGPIINTHGVKSMGWKIPTCNEEILFNIPIIQKCIINKLHYKNIEKEVDAVSGCFFLIDSNHLQNINYFDENVFLYYEENILGIKTKLLNKKVVISDVEVKHDHSVSIDKNFNNLNKVKIQKQSQYYFEKEYNNANALQLILLKITANVTIFLLKIKYMIKK